ncbi:uS10/mL48 family ribosomal protein [Halorarius halobius]|uniref:uS10/mL48 family ribosomal protein n=1 Tax=Halorarius halobius TaxID=2962671 RepID=UPI0020CB984D|nr:uS10/mL48 family ribosomal protein [Halorarius halobius]
MPFVTKLTFQSGDRDALDRVVDDIKHSAEQKGVELKGPHPKPTSDLHVPQKKRLDATEGFDNWRYTVYSREIEIHGNDEFARQVAGDDYPSSIHIEADVKQTRGMGR